MWKYTIIVELTKLNQLRKLKSVVKIIALGNSTYEAVCKGNYLKNCKGCQIVNAGKNYDPIFTIRKKAIKLADTLNTQLDEVSIQPIRVQGLAYIHAALRGEI